MRAFALIQTNNLRKFKHNGKIKKALASILSCSSDDDGASPREEPIVRLAIINGYYGVTADGKTIEMIITEGNKAYTLTFHSRVAFA